MPGGVHARGGGMGARGHECLRACMPCTHPPVNRMTDACENITLPQTSFAGGKNKKILVLKPTATIFPICNYNGLDFKDSL